MIETVAKVLVPNKFWILENEGLKIGTLSKDKKGYSILFKGQKINVGTLDEIKERFGITLDKEIVKKEKLQSSTKSQDIHG